jgi:hypothetical protein
VPQLRSIAGQFAPGFNHRRGLATRDHRALELPPSQFRGQNAIGWLSQLGFGHRNWDPTL